MQLGARVAGPAGRRALMSGIAASRAAPLSIQASQRSMAMQVAQNPAVTACAAARRAHAPLLSRWAPLRSGARGARLASALTEVQAITKEQPEGGGRRYDTI